MFAVVLLIAGCAPPGAAPESATEVVRRYCQLDFDGARLGSSKELGVDIYTLVAWDEEAAWDETTAVRGFTLGPATTEGEDISIPVTYHSLGLVGGESFEPATNEETISFKLMRSGAGWKIREPVIRPHVSPASLKRHFSSLLESVDAMPGSTRAANLGRIVEWLDQQDRVRN